MKKREHPLVLIVEDDRMLGDTVVDILQMLDFETELVTDGLQALNKIAERMPDVVLLDINLPGKSGLDILDEIRANTVFNHIKVIVLTADALRADSAGDKADFILLKPYSVAQLSTLLNRLTEEQKSS
jgi:two-component system, OmpR family, response regulator